MGRHYVYISDAKLSKVLSERLVSSERSSRSAKLSVKDLVEITPPHTKDKSEATRIAGVEDFERLLDREGHPHVHVGESRPGEVFYAQEPVRRGLPFPGAPGVWFGLAVGTTAVVLVGRRRHLGEAESTDEVSISELDAQWDTLTGAAPEGSHGKEWAISCLLDFVQGLGGGSPFQPDGSTAYGDVLSSNHVPLAEMEVLAIALQRISLPGEVSEEFDQLVLGSPYYVAYLR